jgi:hypothetical protein
MGFSDPTALPETTAFLRWQKWFDWLWSYSSNLRLEVFPAHLPVIKVDRVVHVDFGAGGEVESCSQQGYCPAGSQQPGPGSFKRRHHRVMGEGNTTQQQKRYALVKSLLSQLGKLIRFRHESRYKHEPVWPNPAAILPVHLPPVHLLKHFLNFNGVGMVLGVGKRDQKRGPNRQEKAD